MPQNQLLMLLMLFVQFVACQRVGLGEKTLLMLIVHDVVPSLYLCVKPARKGTPLALGGIESRFALPALFFETQVLTICHLAMVTEFKLELRGSEVGVFHIFSHNLQGNR